MKKNTNQRLRLSCVSPPFSMKSLSFCSVYLQDTKLPPPSHMSTFAHSDFNSALFGCFHDQPSFIDGLFCPCCAVSAQYNMLKHGKAGMVAHIYLPLAILNFFSWGLALSCVSVLTRSMLRRHFGLTQESDVHSCCKAFLCAPCSICQVYREMSMRHAWPDGVCVDAPYVRPGMVVPPPQPERMGGASSSPSSTARQSLEHDERQRQQFSHAAPRTSLPPVAAREEPVVYGYPTDVAQPPAAKSAA